MAIIEAAAFQPHATGESFERDVADTQRYFDSPRFEGIIRLYTARQVAEQRGTIPADYPIAREAAPRSTRTCASCSPRARASPRSVPTPPARPW